MLLARKIEAVTGMPWVRGYDQKDQLLTNYNILYGGIDSENVTKRLTSPNGVMVSVATRMANEVACNSVASDFKKAEGDRQLMRYVSMDDVPETTTGDAVPAAVERIKKNLAYLYARVWGEDVALDSDEMARGYALFVDTWREGMGFIADNDDTTPSQYMTYQCWARVDPKTLEEFPEDQQIRTDPNYTIRAWMAVLSYMLGDYQFLYE
jgi:hypothetical protein